MLEESSQAPETEEFARQLSDWQQHINNAKSEG
jgi:hypothetical protein